MEYKKPYLKLAEDEEIERINTASLEILEKTGVEVLHDKALQMLNEAGAKVDFKKRRVRFPGELVEEQVKNARKYFVMAARSPEKDVVLKPNCVYTRPISGPEFIMDHRTQEWRKVTTEDVREWAILNDGLEHINYLGAIYPCDAPLSLRDAYLAKILMENTEKHIQINACVSRGVRCIADMGEIIMGSKKAFKDRPLVSILVSVTSPLRFREDDVETLFICGERGIPVALDSGPISGGTGPVTLAGNIVQLNAEILAGNTILQIAHPGSPVIYNIRPTVMDMRTTVCALGYVENALAASIAVQLGRDKHGFITDVFGPVTDSKVVDEQAMMEKVHNTVIIALAGANLIAGAGELDLNNTVSFVQLVIDNEILGLMGRVIKGVNIDEGTLAKDTITRVGPGGHFLDTDHTLNYYKKEYYQYSLYNREARNVWVNAGSGTLKKNAQGIVRKLIKEHKPQPLDDGIRKEINAILGSYSNQ